MKLRNKKTGRVVNFRHIAFDEPKDDRENYRYSSLAQFNEEWEDYKPKEPLIKDEKVRKAVRAWAEVVPSAQVRYDHNDGRFYTHSDYIQPYSISFPIRLGLEEMTDYTIAELCGEGEE